MSKRALIESDGLSLRDSHALELFKNEGLAPDAAQRVAKFFKRKNPNLEAGGHMPKYVIERDIPGAGKLSAVELKAISQKSCGVLGKMGPQIQWVQSYVTADKIYCVYIAPNEKAVREHAQQGGFPANRVSAVMGVIDPTTAE